MLMEGNVNTTQDARVGIVPGNTLLTAATTPTPYIDEGDFMYIDDDVQAFRNSTGIEGGVFTKHHFDIRAMRKIEEIDETLWWTAQNAGTATIQVFMRARILVLLP